ncbi:MAG TPA: VanZ family protein, partial [Candidatus Eisenbacteria bacterium]|nr:VanZ family protein [Candidatus Eisenbacteria bacterium]
MQVVTAASFTGGSLVLSWNIRRWLPLIVWVIMIFSLSSIPGLSSEDIRLPRGYDKAVHFIEYTIFAMLYYRGLSYGGVRIRWSIVIIVMMSGIAVAGLDEMYQSYIPRRDSSIFDLTMDSAGVITGTLLAVLRHVLQIRKAPGRKAVRE